MSEKLFKKVYLEISNICNLKCSFCPAVERGERQVAEAEFRQRLLKVSPWAERVCLHVMGEPLAHPMFARFVEIAEEHAVPLEITTNATLLTPKLYEALINPAIKQINFSLQSFTDNFPNANPLAYLNKIFAFIDHSQQINPEQYINLRLWNIGDPIAGKDTEFFLKQIENKFSVQINRSVDVGFKKSKKVIGRLYLHFDSRFQWPDLKQSVRSKEGTCYGTRSHLAVLADGAVVPCCLDKEAVMTVGNLDLTDDFSEIIHAQRTQTIREGFKKGLMTEELCQRCDFAQRFKKKSDKSVEKVLIASEKKI